MNKHYELNKSRYILASREWERNNPWYLTYKNAKRRCKPNQAYAGMVFDMTIQDFKDLWFRDKAYLLNEPSIDRIDNSIGYIRSNCRYIERSENNSKKGRKSGLKEKDILDIRKMYENKDTKQKVIAEKYGVHFSTISAIVTRKKWKHIGGE